MPRIQPVDPTAATGAAAEQLAATRKAFGATPNMFLTAAQSPATLTALNSLFGTLGKGLLGGKIGERIAIAVAQQNGCKYCLSAHTAIGGMHGVAAAELDAARHGASADPKASAAIALALAILHTSGRVDDAVLAAARLAGLSDSEIVETVAHVALNVFTNSLNNLADTDVDFPLVSLATAA
ncbi:carboxymuconolactone decarboxylase family protein [Gemmatimonas groenlandica]|uniref:Carboxymuconolactone decarboxylase family protein n=1 Tax=Gemmatimonas groenlandica TaxID=2732249 RepID=A0A6M4IR59_9BACT|nr:carboxymuconolactone decarboxylase family protein [Gemmatimonas groenlandica]QJR37414.1 carboxymuconolactone decarboxylase family protein [Gemmatimonas groenlandica]